MPRRKKPLWLIWQEDDTHISKAIYRELELYAVDEGFYPTQNGLFRLMTEEEWKTVIREGRKVRIRFPPRYQFTLDSFNHWFDRLKSDGYVAIDERTRGIKCTGLIITQRDDRSVELD